MPKRKGGAEADGSMPNAASIAKSKNVKQFDPRKTTFMVVEPERVGVPSTSAILKQFHDTVYECSDKSSAVELLRRPNVTVDIAVIDVAISECEDGLGLLESIRVATNDALPVVLMSERATNAQVLKAVTAGCEDFLTKPVRPQDLRFLWRHALERIVREERGKLKIKKQRMVWTPRLHQKFVDALNEIGVEKATPKKIKEVMRVKGLEREHIASHLQKHRHSDNKLPGMHQGMLQADAKFETTSAARRDQAIESQMMVLGGGVLPAKQPSTSGEQGSSGFDQVYLEYKQNIDCISNFPE